LSRELQSSTVSVAQHRMASSYALPASAMTHGHNHGHGHLHSHSHSPGRQYSANSPRSLKSERSNGSLHAHSLSESHLEPDHTHSHHHNHSRVREPSPSPYLPTPPNSNGLPPIAAFEKQTYQTYELSPALSQASPYEPPSQHDHHEHSHNHTATSPAAPRSRFTSFLLPFMLRWPLLHTILAEKDSRRIFYFMRYDDVFGYYALMLTYSSLNFAFMVVQACYGYLTDSLGLLSDSIHMFFDCLALGVGLFAAVAAKWPQSERFPYGFGKIESLSGFGNGVFLM
jgi:zinc transporter 5/7